MNLDAVTALRLQSELQDAQDSINTHTGEAIRNIELAEALLDTDPGRDIDTEEYAAEAGAVSARAHVAHAHATLALVGYLEMLVAALGAVAFPGMLDYSDELEEVPE